MNMPPPPPIAKKKRSPWMLGCMGVGGFGALLLVLFIAFGIYHSNRMNTDPAYRAEQEKRQAERQAHEEEERRREEARARQEKEEGASKRARDEQERSAKAEAKRIADEQGRAREAQEQATKANDELTRWRQSDTARIAAYVHAKQVVRRLLKAPASATFGSYGESKVRLADTGKFAVSGHVDAQNSFGAMIRSHYACVMTVNTSKKWTGDCTLLQ